MKKILSFMAVCLCVLLCFSACSKKETDVEKTEGSSLSTEESEGKEKILRIGSRYALSSLDVHKEYRGWQTSIYGISETLFKVADDYSLVPWLADSGISNGNEWKIVLKEKVCFSNGDP